MREDRRITDLIRSMSTEEKAGQLNLMPYMDNTDEILELIREGKAGGILIAATALAGSEIQTAPAAEIRKLKQAALRESRLGIPLLIGKDVLHGHHTVFPIPLAMAAGWNPELVQRAAETAALEAAAEGINWIFAPMLDIARDPRWGRIIEGFGEDPYLASQFAAASVKGFQRQAGAGSPGMAACAKHFIGYGASEGGRDYHSAELSDSTIQSVYLPPFEAAVNAGVLTVMASFNDINGEPVTASRRLLTGVLREQLGFEGIVVSDWAAVDQLRQQGAAADRMQAAKAAFLSGVELDMSDGCFMECLPTLIRQEKEEAGRSGLEQRLDQAVYRVLEVKQRLGLFDEHERIQVPVSPPSGLISKDAKNCAFRLACESMVLLKNLDGLLPLRKSGGKIAVVGPMAELKMHHLGSWSLDGREEDVISIAEGIRRTAGETELLWPASPLLDDALSAARQADAVVIVLGESRRRTGEAQSTANISLSPDQELWMECIAAVNKNVITVICAGRPLILKKADQYSKAILYAWHSGIQAGMAAAAILFGEVNPSGRLPVTFPRNAGQIPIYYNHRSPARSIDGYYGGSEYCAYQDESGAPMYPFGYGLSYSEFIYYGLEIKKEGPYVRVSIWVENRSETAGFEVVQCYVKGTGGTGRCSVSRRLVDFRKVWIEGWEKKQVVFEWGEETVKEWEVERKCLVGCGGDCLTLEMGEMVVER